MNLLAKIGSKILSASAVLVVVLVVGCGGDDLGKRYAVSGTITYKGKPLLKAPSHSSRKNQMAVVHLV